ncbi:MAG: RES family NAD+ phosphorylase [Candidatus Baltobacteraceae bacterium]
MKLIRQDGRFFRVCDPSWIDCCDGSYSARFGGRWNPPNSFPVLHLNANLETARANARRVYEGEAFSLMDLNPTARPHLQLLEITRCDAVDAISIDGLEALGLPSDYPRNTGPERCRPIGLNLYEKNVTGIAARSAALDGGKELALMHLQLATKHQRLPFNQWYLQDGAEL